jgi:hypothetical protein
MTTYNKQRLLELREQQVAAYLACGFTEAEARIAAGCEDAIAEAERRRVGTHSDPYQLLESTRRTK